MTDHRKEVLIAVMIAVAAAFLVCVFNSAMLEYIEAYQR
jgi:hypothetical protein